MLNDNGLVGITPIEKKRVLIGVPSGEMMHADFACCLVGLYAGTPGVKLSLCNAKGSLITVNRNNIVQQALKVGADYILFLDTDMVFPMDALTRLLAHGKDIVGAAYCKRKAPYTLLGEVLSSKDEQPSSGLIEMARMPTGVLLIATKVFKDYPLPWFRELYEDNQMQTKGEDYYFCDQARAAGYKIWCDIDLTAQLGHIGDYVVRCGVTSEAPQEDALAHA